VGQPRDFCLSIGPQLCLRRASLLRSANPAVCGRRASRWVQSPILTIERSHLPVAAGQIRAAARRLLDASTLCAIATVASGGRAHVNTAYFAWGANFEIVWLSEPRARHSCNISANDSVAIAVYDSSQSWGKPDRGIQLFGTAERAQDEQADEAARLYTKRFPAYASAGLGSYRLYVFRPRRIRLFDEHALGAGTFITARVGGDQRLAWERTDIYHPER